MTALSFTLLLKKIFQGTKNEDSIIFLHYREGKEKEEQEGKTKKHEKKKHEKRKMEEKKGLCQLAYF